MVILTIVCVPLLRSFATSAQTNAKAKLQMKCTTASENIMEDIRNMPTEAIETTYSGCTNFVNNTASGDIHFEIEDNALMKGDLPDGYKAVVDLNANYTPSGSYAYPNANGLNVSDFSPISVRDCAIYTMPSGYDKEAYKWYETHKKPSSSWDAKKFKKDLTRDIIFEIEDTGIDFTDDDGVSYDAVRVKMKIQYYCNTSNQMDSENRTYVASELYLFDNTATKRPLNGIYLFYYPRYEAANNGGAISKDVIEIKNPSNIKTNVYVVAMNNPPGESSTGRDAYFNNKRLKLYVDENGMTDGKAAITLRTNLLDNVLGMRTPYSKGDPNESSYGLACSLVYRAGGAPISNDAAIKPLTVSDIDGKKLDVSETDVRIYRVTVSIVDPDGVVYSKMEGTKLRY